MKNNQPTRIEELTALGAENKKVYRLSDGTQEAVFTPTVAESSARAYARAAEEALPGVFYGIYGWSDGGMYETATQTVGVEAYTPLGGGSDEGNGSGDSCENAIGLPLTGTVHGTVTADKPVVWYSFMTLEPKTFTFFSEGDLDTVGTLYDDNMQPVAASDDDGNAFNFRLSAFLMMGRTYYLKVTSYSGKAGSFDLTISDDGSRNYFASRMYMNLSLSLILPSQRVRRARLVFNASGAKGSPSLALYKLAGSVSANASIPAEDTYPLDVARSVTDRTLSFDVTSLIESGATCGLVVRALDEAAGVERYVTLGTPELRVAYESSYAIDTSRAVSYELSRFGRGYVDLKYGNLMLEGEDFSWSGGRMPISVRHLYNSALAGYDYTESGMIGLFTADFSAMKLGHGFKLNLMQSMVLYGGRYIHLDENGNERYFVQSEDNENVYIPEDDGDAAYDKTARTLTEGNTILTFDTFGRLISERVGENQTVLTYANGRLTTVTDAVGRAFTLTYSGDHLISIKAPDGTEISYTYMNDLLSTVLYPDGRYAFIAYSDDKLTSVTLYDASGTVVQRVAYTFSGKSVARVTEYGRNGQAGKRTDYTYSASANRTVLTENLGEDGTAKTVYTFDEDGSIAGEYLYTPEAGNVGMNGEAFIGNAQNFLFGHNLEDLDGWTAVNVGALGVTRALCENESDTKLGKKCLSLCGAEASSSGGVEKRSAMLFSGEYTLSAYVRITESFEGEDCGVFLRAYDGDDTFLGESEKISKADGDYTRLILPFVRNEVPMAVRVQILTKGKGVALVDGVQLENNAYATPYNFLENSGFEWGTEPWSVPSDATHSADAFHSEGSLCLVGSLLEKKAATQSVSVKTSPSIREAFTLSGWAKSVSLPSRAGEDAPAFRLCAEIVYADGEKELHAASFSPATEEWQLASVDFAKSKYKEVARIDVLCEYSYNLGTAYFDGISLVRHSIEEGLSEEDFLSGEVYDDGYTVREEDTAEPFEELLDEYGNALTETTFTDGELGTIYRAFGFTENGNDLVSETDARGNDTVYTVDSVTSRNEEVTDRLGNKTAYEYDAAGRTTKVTSKKASGAEIARVSYAYDAFDNMTEITRGDGMKYALAYNAFHNLESIGIDGKAEKLIKYTYKNESGRLKQMTYANGHTMKATYNALGQMVAEKWFDSEADAADSTKAPTKHYKYTYNGEGNIVRSIDITAKKEYTYIYEEGKLVRATEADITLSDEIITAKTVVHTIRYYYDGEGNLTRKVISPVDGEAQTVYYENNDNGTVAKFTVGNNTVTSHSKTDSFGRKVFDELQLGTGFLSREFSYHKGEVTETHAENGKLKSSPTTQLVSKILLSDGRTLSYEYDAEERITKVTDSTLGETVYTYDALGQLLTETVKKDGVTTVVNSMEYDNYGNILSKNGVAYVYGNAKWKDLLTTVNGQLIEYDAQGNPTNYLGHTLTWEKGRQLRKFDNIEYTYNANGIRTSKTVNGIKHTYTLDGTKILREAWGSNTLVPLYDNEDSVCGIIYNGVPYYFIKNLQGDVIAIANRNGKTVAEYSYDAWGVPTILSDSTGVIANINPYRYRSYYYDAEIAKYYLQSRYYDASVGRFVSGDDSVFAILFPHVVSHNLFGYCLNAPINLKDYNGNIAIEAASTALVALFVVLLALVQWMSTEQFQKMWVDFCTAAGNGLSSISNSITNVKIAILNWTLQKLLALIAAVTAFITIVSAEAHIRSTVKRNSKQRYWAASILKVSNCTYVVISSAISYTVAKTRVAMGLSVFTVTKTEARQLASKFPPVVGPEIGLKDAGQYRHYHVRGRKNKSHIFFLF